MTLADRHTEREKINSNTKREKIKNIQARVQNKAHITMRQRTVRPHSKVKHRRMQHKATTIDVNYAQKLRCIESHKIR